MPTAQSVIGGGFLRRDAGAPGWSGCGSGKPPVFEDSSQAIPQPVTPDGTEQAEDHRNRGNQHPTDRLSRIPPRPYPKADRRSNHGAEQEVKDSSRQIIRGLVHGSRPCRLFVPKLFRQLQQQPVAACPVPPAHDKDEPRDSHNRGQLCQCQVPDLAPERRTALFPCRLRHFWSWDKERACDEKERQGQQEPAPLPPPPHQLLS